MIDGSRVGTGKRFVKIVDLQQFHNPIFDDGELVRCDVEAEVELRVAVGGERLWSGGGGDEVLIPGEGWGWESAAGEGGFLGHCR